MENITMEKVSFVLAVLSFCICLLLLYKRHKDELSRRIPDFNPFEENEIVSQASEYNSPVTSKPTSSSYIIKITNTTDVVKNCNLFGLGEYIFSKNFGSDDGIKVEMDFSNISYLFMLMQSAFKPFETSLIQLKSTNEEQLEDSIITINSKDANGELCQMPLMVSSYVKPDFNRDENGDLLDKDKLKNVDIHYCVGIDVNTNLQLDILPKTELLMCIYQRSKFDASRALRNNDVLREYSAPKTNN